MIKHATQMLRQLNPKREGRRQLGWFNLKSLYASHLYVFKCHIKPIILSPFVVSVWHFQTDCWNGFQQQTKPFSLAGCFLIFGLFLYSGQDEGENDKTLLCLMSMVYHWGCGGRRLEALQELLSHHAGKGGDERWNLCLSWQAGTVTAAQIAQAPKETAANCGVAREETGRDWGNAEPAARVPVPRPRLQTQTAKVPACHQGHTDGLLLGGCGCNTDLRAKSPPLCSSPHSYSHYSSANQHVHHSWKNTLCLQ